MGGGGHEVVLGGEGGFVGGAGDGEVTAARAEEEGVDVVFKFDGEEVLEDPAADSGIEHGVDDFDAAEKVAGHPVGAAGEDDGGVAVVVEVEGAAVFEVAADEGADADVIAEAADAGDEAADAADDEVDLNAGAGGGVEVVDGGLIDEGVEFDEDAGGVAGFGAGGFGEDEFLDAGVEVKGGDEEVFKLGGATKAGEGVEEAGDVVGDALVGGEGAEVGVEAGGLGVIVAGAEVDVAAEFTGFAADDEGALAVGFMSDEAVNDVDAGFFELAGPLDVIGFVEAGLEFDQGGDLFAAAGGLDEGADDGGVAAGAVEGLFDGEDVGVAGGLFDEIDDGLEAVVGVVEEDVVFAEGVEDVFGVAKGGGVDGGEGEVFKVGAIEVAEAHEAEKIDGAVEAEDVFLGEVEVFAEGGEEDFADVAFDFEADGGTAAEVAEFFLDFFEEVFGFFLVDVEVAVAGDAEGVGADDAVAGEEGVGAAFDDVAEEDEALATAVAGGVEADETGEDTGDGEDDDEVFDFGGFGVIEGDDDVEGFVAELGEGVGLVNGEGGEDGEDLFVEVGLDPGEFAGGELVGGFEGDAFEGEGGDEVVVPAAVLVFDEGGDDGVDAAELFAWAEAVVAEGGDVAIDLLDKAGDADFEKFVEVGGDDGEEFDALEEGVEGRLGLFEDAAVEGEPGEFAVKVSGFDGASGRGDGDDAAIRGEDALVFFGGEGGGEGGGGHGGSGRGERATGEGREMTGRNGVVTALSQGGGGGRRGWSGGLACVVEVAWRG